MASQPAGTRTMVAALARQQDGGADLVSKRIEVEGKGTVAKAVNASLYYIHSAIRADWPHGLSPGGLAIDSYDGRSFWGASNA